MTRWKARAEKASKWLLWLTCFVAVGWCGWLSWFKPADIPFTAISANLPSAVKEPTGHAAHDVSSLAAPASIVAADSEPMRSAMQRFPADPDLWSIAASELLGEDPKTAAKLLLSAAEAPDCSAAANENAAIACLLAGEPLRAARQLALIPGGPQSVTTQAASAACASALGSEFARPEGNDPLFAAMTQFLGLPIDQRNKPPVLLIRLAGQLSGEQLTGKRLLALWLPDPRDAVQWARRAADASGTIEDWTRYAVLLRRAGRDASAPEERLAQQCRSSAKDARLYLARLMVEGREKEALEWIGSLPAPLATDSELQERKATIECRLGLNDALQTSILAGAWGPLPGGGAVMEYAAGAVTAAHRGDAALADQSWAAALSAAGADARTLTVLVRMAETAGIKAQTEAAFTALLSALKPVNSTAAAAPAAPPLQRLMVAWRFAVWSRLQEDKVLAKSGARVWLDANPDSEFAQAAWARLALIDGGPAEWHEAADLLDSLSQKHGEYLPLLAFARHVEGRDGDAVGVLSRLAQVRLPADEREWAKTTSARIASILAVAPP